MASANAPSLKGAHAQRGLCEPWESTTLIRTLPKRAKRQHSDTRENPSLCFQQFTPTPRKHGLVSTPPALAAPRSAGTWPRRATESNAPLPASASPAPVFSLLQARQRPVAHTPRQDQPPP